MAENQPPTIVKGATTGDIEDEVPVAKSAEDRKAAAALSSLDTAREEDAMSTRDVDQEAVRKAMERLGGAKASNGTQVKKDEQRIVKKTVKVDQADVTLLVEELELNKIRAADLLKLHDGDAEKALRAYIAPIA